jgi:tight adherence protein C
MSILILLCTLLAVLTFAGGVGVVALSDRNFNSRLAARLQSGGDAAPRLEDRIGPALEKLLTRWGAKAGRGAIEADKRAEVRLRMIQAGFTSPHAVEMFFGVRASAAVILGMLGLLLAMTFHMKGVLGVAGPLMLGANLGLFIPNMMVSRRIKERCEAMQLGLPDAVDLTVVSIEAGATLSASFQRVVGEFNDLHPILCEQFGMMLMEMQAGASRSEALTRMAHRCPSEELSGLCTMLIQSEAVGASIGMTLRVFADELRRNRFLEAERKAAELPVKIAFPLVFCILPCLGAVIFIPVAIRILHVLGSLPQH